MTTRKQRAAENLTALKLSGLHASFGYDPELAAKMGKYKKPAKKAAKKAAKKKSPAKKPVKKPVRKPAKKAPAKKPVAKPASLQELKAKSDKLQAAWLTAIKKVVPGATEWDWHHSIDPVKSNMKRPKADYAKLKASKAIKDAHKKFIKALHAFYVARDGDGGVLGRYPAVTQAPSKAPVAKPVGKMGAAPKAKIEKPQGKGIPATIFYKQLAELVKVAAGGDIDDVAPLKDVFDYVKSKHPNVTKEGFMQSLRDGIVGERIEGHKFHPRGRNFGKPDKDWSIKIGSDTFYFASYKPEEVDENGKEYKTDEAATEELKDNEKFLQSKGWDVRPRKLGFHATKGKVEIDVRWYDSTEFRATVEGGKFYVMREFNGEDLETIMDEIIDDFDRVGETAAAKKKKSAKRKPAKKKAPAKRKAAPKPKAKRGPTPEMLAAMAELRTNPYLFFRKHGSQRTRQVLNALPIAQVRKWAKSLNISSGTKKSELDAIIKLMETETDNARRLLTKAVPAVKNLRAYVKKFRAALNVMRKG